MIEFYSFDTPNGKKVEIFLDLLKIPYNKHVINIMQGDQNNEDFKKLNPNQKIPTITDTEPPFQKEPITLWESGAILIYLAENYDKEKIFFPVDEPSKKYEVLKWLFFQMAGIGPMFGQVGYFWKYCKEDVPLAKERYMNEMKRLFGVLEGQLSADHQFIVGNSITIADIATYPWIGCVYNYYKLGEEVGKFPNVTKWWNRVGKIVEKKNFPEAEI